MRTTLVKLPALTIVLSVVVGVLLAEESYIGGGFLLFCLAYLFTYSVKKHVTCAVVLGIVAYCSHENDYARLKVAEQQLQRFSDTSFELKISRAKVLEVTKQAEQYFIKVKVLTDSIPLYGVGAEVPYGVVICGFIDGEVFPGEVLSLTGYTIQSPYHFNFGERKRDALMKKNGQVATVVVTSFERLEWGFLEKMGCQWRNRIKTFLLYKLRVGVSADSPSQTMLPALLFGERPTDKEWVKPYRDVGVMHMFVVSGLHVGMVMGGAWLLLYLTPLSSKKALVISLLFTWLYAWLSGMNPPVFRSVLVITIYVSGFLIERRVSALNSLLVAFLAVLLLNHYAIHEIGVWLSFGVVFGLIILGDYFLNKSLPFISPDPYLPRSLWRRRQRLRVSFLRWVVGILCTSFIAWTISSFITAGSFGKVYVYGILASWLILPALFSMMFTSGIVVLLSPIFTDSLRPLNQLNHTLCEYVMTVVETVDALPYSVYNVNDYGYKDALTVFNLPKGGSSLVLGAQRSLMIDTGKAHSASSLVYPILDKAGVEIKDLYISHQDSGHNGGVEHFSDADLVLCYESYPFIMERDGWVIESIPVSVPLSRRADNRVALFKFSKGGYSIGYIGDAGYPILREMKKRRMPFSCDVLITGRNGHGEECLEDFCSYSGATHLIIGRSYYFTALKKVIGVKTYDQRYCGAARVVINATGLHVETTR